jgi:hypothetical protein
MLEVKYVAMPITVEQKKEYHRQGFRVIDARFAPADAVIETHADGVERTVTLGPADGKRSPLAETEADAKAKKAAERKAAREAKKAAAEQPEE